MKTSNTIYDPKNNEFNRRQYNSKHNCLLVINNSKEEGRILHSNLNIITILKSYKNELIRNEAIIEPNLTNDYFGSEFAVSDDKNVLAISAPGISLVKEVRITESEGYREECYRAGIVCVYRWIHNRYNIESVLLPKYINSNGYFGSYLKISRDGNTITAGKYSPGLLGPLLLPTSVSKFEEDSEPITYNYTDVGSSNKVWVAKDL